MLSRYKEFQENEFCVNKSKSYRNDRRNNSDLFLQDLKFLGGYFPVYLALLPVNIEIQNELSDREKQKNSQQYRAESIPDC
jgi:hypothetical protein